MTSTAATKSNNPSVTIYGNVGNDPETINFEARTEMINVYDPVIDDMVEKQDLEPGRLRHALQRGREL